MSYCIVHYKEVKGEGWAPDLPESASFLVLADPGREAQWALVKVDGLTEREEATLIGISDELQGLLDSGRMYPPALALARNEIRRTAMASLAVEEFQAAYGAMVRRHLQAQRSAGYVLAGAARTEPGYLSKGGFYWVLSFDPESGSVRWVSADYHVYRNAASDFVLGEDELRRLPRS